MFGGQGVALFREGHLQSLEFCAFFEFSLACFDDAVLHLQRVVPHQRLRLFHQLLVLFVLFTDLLVLLLALLRLLAQRTPHFSADVLCGVSSPILKLCFDPSAIVVGVLVLYKIAKVDEAFGKVLVFLSFEGVVSFLDVGHPLFSLQGLSLLVAFEECWFLVVFECTVLLNADLGEDGIGLSGETIVDAHAIQQKIGMILFSFIPFADLVLLY